MKIVIPGGSGHVGASLRRHYEAQGAQVVSLSRSGEGVRWDGETLGDWAREIDGADAVINLAGRTVNCRYTPENLRQMMDSRVLSTRVVGQAIAAAQNPPAVWLQASTATIYASRRDAANTESEGIISTEGPWSESIRIALAWEAELEAAPTPRTRKVALRSAMTMSPDSGSVFDVLRRLTARGLGGRIGDGGQYVSWIHERDFCRALDFIIARPDLSGPINIAAPNPLPQAEFQRVLRQEMGVKIGLPATAWMAKMGAWLMQTETELILKSRRVAPQRLLEAGFDFEFPTWEEAVRDLLGKN